MVSVQAACRGHGMIPRSYLCAFVGLVLCYGAICSPLRAQQPFENEFTLYYSDGDSKFYKRTYRGDPPILLPYGQLRLKPNMPPIAERQGSPNYDFKLQLLNTDRAYLLSRDGEDKRYVDIDAQNRERAAAARVQQEKDREAERQRRAEQERQRVEREQRAKSEQDAEVRRKREDEARLQNATPGVFTRAFGAMSDFGRSSYNAMSSGVHIALLAVWGFVATYWKEILTSGSAFAFVTAIYAFFTRLTARIFFIGVPASGKTGLHMRLTNPGVSEYDILNTQTTPRGDARETRLEPTIRHGRYTFSAESVDHAGTEPAAILNKLAEGFFRRRFLRWKKPIILIAVLSCTKEATHENGKVDADLVKTQANYFSIMANIISQAKFVTKPAGCIIFVSKADVFSGDAMEMTMRLSDAMQSVLAHPIEVIVKSLSQQMTTQVMVGSAAKSWQTNLLLEKCVDVAAARRRG